MLTHYKHQKSQIAFQISIILCSIKFITKKPQYYTGLTVLLGGEFTIASDTTSSLPRRARNVPTSNDS